ncbi:hypothetical protein K7X08_005996 [Anisodus acutangulus]|uniref:plastoquinol--plastocyanin reductase n=1 Tax=Anisodus acutangulus TaxID=402998 RepID=A0A9Q1LVK4_9SOLA|nr:hypothetical protein K7X08_005996 [Anisodus acutangulus]
MAASTKSPITPSQLSVLGCPFFLCSSKSGQSSISLALLVKPMKISNGTGKEKRMGVRCMATSFPADDRVPDMGKRQLIGGGGSGGIIAKDALGNDVIASEWLKTHGDPTYLVVENDGTLATYGINAVCTHLGCVVPFNTAENKFICPCHGSQYNNQGRVVRGPVPLSLALAHADIDDGKVVFVPWVETDFRTGEAPWWA